MAKKILNIEVGERLTKVVVSQGKGKAASFSKSFQFKTPNGTVVDGQIMQPELFAQEFIAQLTSNGCADVKSAVFALTSSKIVSREVVLPPVKENKLKALVMTNAPDYFPVDLSAYQVSYDLLEKVTGENPGNRVLITAVPKNIIMSYDKFITVTKLAVEGFDHSANSQYQIFKKLPQDGITMFVSISSRQTLATFMKEGVLLLQRTFPFGADEIITTAMQAANIDEDRFIEALDLCANKEWVDMHLPLDQRDSIFSRLVGGIARSADFFKSAYKGATVEHVVLLDTCANIAGLKEAVGEAVNVDVKSLSELPGSDKVAGSLDLSYFASCIGSALAPLDLIPDELSVTTKKKTSSANSLTLPIAVFAVCAVAGIGIATMTLLDYFSATGELEAVQQEILELDPVVAAYNEYTEYQLIESNLQNIEITAVNNNSALHAFLLELERKMPSNLMLLSASCDNSGVSLNIQVETMDDAAVVISQLRTFESLVNISISGISESTDNLSIPITTFSVSATYPVPEPIVVEPVEGTTEEPIV